MKKSTVALISIATFFLGATLFIGAIIGFLISPIKAGVVNNWIFNNCGNNDKLENELEENLEI